MTVAARQAEKGEQNVVKLSAPEWCFIRPGMDPDEYYQRLRRLGYSGAEMAAPERWSAARNAGLELVNIAAPSIEQGLNRIENHPEAVGQVKKTIRTAGENQIGQVIIFSGNREGQPDEEGIDNCARAMEELLPEAEDAGVVLAFEMLNTCDHPDYQADRAAYGFKLAQKVGSERLKLIYDIYHMERMGEDAAEDITSHIRDIAHLHLAESPQRDMPREDGNISYRKIAPAAMKAGYEGYWGMEFVPRGDVFDELERAAELMRRLCGAE